MVVRRVCWVPVLLGIAGFALAQDPPKPNPAQPDITEPVAIARIRTARTSVESYAKALKARYKKSSATFDEVKKNSKPDTDAYKKAEEVFKAETKMIESAQQKYIAAYAAYDGWVAALKTGIVAGKSKKLAQDASYKTIAADASKAAGEFVTFATPNLSASERGKRGFIAVLSSLAELGIKAWETYTKSKAENAKLYAEYVATQIQWREWDKI